MAAKTRDAAQQSLVDALDARTTPGALVVSLPNERVRCVACGHRCLIPPGARGICQVRRNQDGVLRVPRGYVGALQVDPVEKKPFYHLLPGATALSFGMLGCDFHCGYCQNWVTSQALRDPAALSAIEDRSAAQLVDAALRGGSRLVVSTYNEPLITAEWAVEVFREARAAGLMTAFVSNGNATPEVLDYLHPWIDAYKVDLKSMNDRSYRRLGGVLENVLDTIRELHRREIWMEVVTLIVPGFNDTDAELRAAAEFLAGVSPNIPWHVTAFHPDYKMQESAPTLAATLLRAAAFGREAGLRYVYPGNLAGAVSDEEHTRCPGCAATLVRRVGFRVDACRLGPDGSCLECGVTLAGIWGQP